MGYRKVIVGTAPTIIAPYNPKRTGLTIYNSGSVTVYVSDNPTNIIEEGFPVDTGVTIGWLKVDGDTPEYALYGQVAAGTGELRVMESFGEVPAR
jgi:hypothetical protein